MKHTWQITALLILIFFVSQILGLFVVYEYVSGFNFETGQWDFKPLPFGQERPDVEPTSSFLPIIIAVLIGTVMALVLIKLKWFFIWKIWFFLAVWLTVTVSVGAFLPSLWALTIALLLALLKVFRRSVIFHNLTEIFIYSGIAAILVPVMNMVAAVVLLIIISVYDFWAVNKSKHMIRLAQAQSKLEVFAGLQIPYSLPQRAPKRAQKGKVRKIAVRSAILGGGDIAFALLFTGVAMKFLGGTEIVLGFQKALIIPLFTTAALAYLLFFGKKDKFYPAMPFITAGCLLGYLVAWLV